MGRGALRGSTQVPGAEDALGTLMAVTGLPGILYSISSWLKAGSSSFQTPLAGGFRRFREGFIFHGGGSQSVTSILCRCPPGTRPAQRFHVLLRL